MKYLPGVLVLVFVLSPPALAQKGGAVLEKARQDQILAKRQATRLAEQGAPAYHDLYQKLLQGSRGCSITETPVLVYDPASGKTVSTIKIKITIPGVSAEKILSAPPVSDEEWLKHYKETIDHYFLPALEIGRC
jgi:hypothetical protein